MNILTDCIRGDGEYAQLRKAVVSMQTSRTALPILVTGLCDGAADVAYAALIEDIRAKDRRPVLLICPEEKECVRIKQFLEQF